MPYRITSKNRFGSRTRAYSRTRSGVEVMRKRAKRLGFSDIHTRKVRRTSRDYSKYGLQG